ncbi:MAG: radical SAM protein, partial [Candidatus Aenigmarchaeota archaeon]|nr:radical SAM protein [Candidatus Aenigmarchaeota archaeon]
MTENPKTLVIVLTEKCNLKCPYCRASGGEGTKKLNFNFIKKAIDYFIEKGYDKPYIRVNFYAKGEPTTEFNLMKTTYKYLQSKTDKIKSSIFTNGVFSKKIAKWLSKNIDMIDMSVDGYPKIQNKQRPLKNGNASSPIVEKNIKYFIRNGNYLRINSVITNFSVHKQSEILKYFYSLGVKKIIFTPVVIEGSCIENNIQYLDRKVFLDNFLKARELAEDFSISLTSGYRLLDRKTKKYCDLGHLFLLLPDNYISTCRAVVSKNAKNAEPFIIGKYDPIKDKIYIDEDKRKKLEKIDLYNFSTCLKCPIKYKCAGGCLRQWKSFEKFFKTNKNSGEVKISGKPDKKVCGIKIDTVEKYKNYRIQKYEKNKIPYLGKKAFGYNYNMFFNKFKLYKTKNNQKISGSSF